jgi:hypothetical protein
MTFIDTRWDNLTAAEWDAFALAWIAELNGLEPPPLPKLPVLFPDDPEKTASEFVTPMNFTASAESQWRFIEAAFRLGNDKSMGHLAAGPVEHLLGHHGEDYIDRFEALALADRRFAQMLTRCYKYFMNNAVWERICAARTVR